MWSKSALTNTLFLAIGVLVGVFVDGLFFRTAQPLPVPSDSPMRPSGHNVFVSSPSPSPGNSISHAISDPERPVMVVDESDYDFGSQETGKTITHQFAFHNHGKSILRVTDVRAACGCTVAKVSATKLLPGTSAFVEVKLNLTRLKGEIKKHLVVETNDPQTPITRFSMHGNVIMNVDVTPEITRIPRIQAGDSVTKNVRVSALKDLKFEITGLTTSRPDISANFATINPGREYTITIVYDAPDVSGLQEAWVHVHTDHSGIYNKIDLPISAVVVGGTNPAIEATTTKSPDFETVPK